MDADRSVMDLTWTARRVSPVVLLYVVAVFIGFMAAAHFVFHSPAAVKALFSAAIAGVASLVPSILSRFEYRLTDTGLARRSLRGKQHAEIQELFLWDQLSHVVPTSSGFKFFKRLDTIIVPLDGRHASGNSVFGRLRGYPVAGSLHVETIEPILTTVEAQGLCQKR